VVTTDVAGQSEIVEDGVSGFIAEAPTLGAFGKVLDRVWERRMELEAMGKAASACIRRYIPTDPAHIFAEKIKTLVSTDLC